jgi:uncharacterized protein (DUF2267 family)
MSDRDDLAALIRRVDWQAGRVEPADAEEIADAVIAAGFRRIVTPEQIEAVADMLRQPAVTTALGRIMRARMITKELGLSMDGAE